MKDATHFRYIGNPGGSGNGSYINVSVNESDITFEIHELKCYGFPDEDRTESVSLKKIRQLFKMPVSEPDHFKHIESFWIPPIKRWLTFILTSCDERGHGPHDEDYSGPYLSKSTALPSSYDEKADDTKIVRRCVSQIEH